LVLSGIARANLHAGNIPSRPVAIRVLQHVIAANLQPRCGGLSGSLAPTTFVQVYAISAAWIVGGNWLIAVNSDDTTLRDSNLYGLYGPHNWSSAQQHGRGRRFRHAACKRRKAKTDHLVERRFRILLIFHD
jgi:hypothetical protein